MFRTQILIVLLWICCSACTQIGQNQPTSNTDNNSKLNRIGLKEDNISILDVTFFSDSTGWAKAMNANQEFLLLHTKDNGLMWDRVLPNYFVGYSNPMYFLNGREGWVTSFDDSTVYVFYTHDGGKSWSKKSELRTENTAFNLHFVNNQVGWMTNLKTAIGAVSNKVEILVTIDGGLTWESLSKDSYNIAGALMGGAFLTSPQTGFIAAGKVRNAEIAFTNDFGKSWTTIPLEANFGDWVSQPMQPIILDRNK